MKLHFVGLRPNVEYPGHQNRKKKKKDVNKHNSPPPHPPPKKKNLTRRQSATKSLPLSDRSHAEGKQIEVLMCSFAVEQFFKQAVGYFLLFVSIKEKQQRNIAPS